MKRVLGHGAEGELPCCPAEPTDVVSEDVDELTELDFEFEEDEE